MEDTVSRRTEGAARPRAVHGVGAFRRVELQASHPDAPVHSCGRSCLQIDTVRGEIRAIRESGEWISKLSEMCRENVLDEMKQNNDKVDN